MSKTYFNNLGCYKIYCIIVFFSSIIFDERNNVIQLEKLKLNNIIIDSK